MDDRPFYGGTLHLSYAPEYESVEDTRHKLQERRKDIARRLRKLHKECSANVSADNSGQSSSTVQGIDEPIDARSSSQTSSGQDLCTSQLIGPQKPDSALSLPAASSVDLHQSVDKSSSTSLGDFSENVPKQLPAPPRPLPVWEWEDPVSSHDQYPRLPTAHATLPQNFNPYPDGYEPVIPGNEKKQHCEEGRNLMPVSEPVKNTEGQPVTDVGALDPVKTGARPKSKFPARRNQPPCLRFLDRIAWRDADKQKGVSARNETGSQDGTSTEYRTHRGTVKRPHPNQYPDPSYQSTARALPDPQTSFVPRQLQGKRKHCNRMPSQPELAKFELSCDGGVGQSERRGHGGAGSTEDQLPLNTGSISFDRTVQDIRRQMRNVVPGSSRLASTQYQAAPPPQPAAAAAPAAAAGDAADGPSATKRLRI
ncbi:uncharacterized protein LOC110973350 isoform X2 [Acanthaster planci]|nr:uncharacterized protein LOC110973350 isoform X2 [Acanthaster planci]